ncbi:2,3-bisphosphoglycerate-dependent phosphoglycerate mutase [Spatholobus suberectus]|nr:2,3-bisphosphoglycerate-dependent phosphoglycerate mutase [Spatholobus suberectus]
MSPRRRESRLESCRLPKTDRLLGLGARCGELRGDDVAMDFDFLNKKKKKEVAVQLSSLTPPFSKVETVRLYDLHFDLLQPSDQELDPHNRFEFGNFVARPVLLDEEYRTTAWVRAKSGWEN